MIQPAHAAFIDGMETLGIAGGTSPSIARVLGYLTVCEPARQSADDIRRALTLSTGSVSSAVRFLHRTKLIERVRIDGDRRFYYELNSDGWRRSTLQSLQLLRHFITLAEDGLTHAPNNPRLIAMRDIYTLFNDEIAALAKRIGQ